MPATRQISITLPQALADQLADRIAAGEFSDESAAVQCGLIDLFDGKTSAPDRLTFQQWLHTEVLPAYDELEACPETALSLEEVRASLAGRRAQRSAP